MQSVLITPEGIRKNLKSIKPLNAICEYIWNGFDAEATCVEVKLHENQLGIINMITIEDNGTGIPYEELTLKFQPFNESKKSGKASGNNHTLPHGQKGIGRLTFFAFAQTARWETVYSKDGQHYKYYIGMNRDSLNCYDDNDGKDPLITAEQCGTKVIFTQIELMDKEQIIHQIKDEFFWFLELNKNNNFQIVVDGIKIDCSDYVIGTQLLDVSKIGLADSYEIKIVQWSTSLGNEYSRIYFMGDDYKERFKETTKLNRQSDQFYHSVFVTSGYFNSFHYTDDEYSEQGDLFNSKSDDEYKLLIETINTYLIQYRKEYFKEASENYIKKLEEKNIYPEFDTRNPIDTYRKQELDNLVGTLYAAQPKIFTGLSNENQRITLELLKLIMDNGNKNELFDVLQQIINLDESELQELHSVLQQTTLSNITKTVKLLVDRQKVIQTLKELVFNKVFNTYEVPHIQKVVEEHYWLFGEQYNLITAAEPDFKQALEGLILTTTGQSEKVDIEHEDRNKEMDIYMVRKDRHGKVTENVVVELKRPSVHLGEKEVSQVKRYMRVIKSDSRFNAGNVRWTFFLVGTCFDKSNYIEDELDSHKAYGEQHLIHSQDNGMTKIYVLKWSEIFDDYEKRHDFLMERLKLEEKIWLEEHESADEAVGSLEGNSAQGNAPVIKTRS